MRLFYIELKYQNKSTESRNPKPSLLLISHVYHIPHVLWYAVYISSLSLT